MVEYPLLSFIAFVLTIYCIGFLYWSAKRKVLASPSAIYAGLVLIHFGISGLLLGLGVGPKFVNDLNMDYSAEAALFALLALIAVQAGAGAFVTPQSQEFSTTYVDSNRLWVDQRVLIIISGLLVVGWAARVYVVFNSGYFQITRGIQGDLEGPYYAVIRLFEEFPMYALSVIVIRAYRREPLLSQFWNRALVIQILLELIYWLPTGRKEETILVFIIPAIGWYLLRLRLPSRRLIFGFIIFVAVLFPVMHIYRVAMELSEASGGVLQVIRETTEGIDDSRGHMELSAAEIAIGRISLMEPASTCVRLWYTDEWTRLPGETYLEGLYGFVPRFLWPGKPDLHYGTEFGAAAGILGEDDTVTSISVSFLGEAFLNFGWLGLFPLYAFGAFFRWIYHLRGSEKEMSETGLLIYMILLPTLLYIGGTFALYFGGLVKILPFFFLLGLFMEPPRLRTIATSSPSPSLSPPTSGD